MGLPWLLVYIWTIKLTNVSLHLTSYDCGDHVSTACTSALNLSRVLKDITASRSVSIIRRVLELSKFWSITVLLKSLHMRRCYAMLLSTDIGIGLYYKP